MGNGRFAIQKLYSPILFIKISLPKIILYNALAIFKTIFLFF